MAHGARSGSGKENKQCIKIVHLVYQIDQSTLEARISAIIPSPFHSHILAFLAYLKTPDPRDYYDAAASVFA